MFCFIPVGQRVVCNSLSAATLVIVRLFYLSDSQLYRQLSSLLATEVICDDEPQALETKTPIKRFIEDLFICMNDGLICQKYLNGKVNELFFLFKAYYSAYDIKTLFKGVVTRDFLFIENVYQRHMQHKTVESLAKAMNNSTSTFRNRFKEVFGIPAYQWMKQQKIILIQQELELGTKSFKEIAYEYNFSSVQVFNDFYKTNFGKSPGEIRKVTELT